MQYFKPIDAFFKDRNWLIVLGWLALYTLTVIGCFAVTGYVIRVVKRVKEGVEELPEAYGGFDNLMDMWMDGLRFFVSTLIYSVPAIVIGIIVGGMFTAFILGSDHGHSEQALGVGVFVGILIGCSVVLLISLLMSTISPALFIMASEDPGWGFAFNFSRLAGIIKADFGTYTLLFLAVFAYLLVFGLCGNIIPVVGGLIFTPLAQVCMGHLIGQYARTVAG